MDDDRAPWWKGTRGEWLVVVQLTLMAVVFLGPRRIGDIGSSPWPAARAWQSAGLALMISGLVLLLAGAVRLGHGLTPLPYPKDGAQLIDTGPFALVRHPMYSGGILIAFGWALCACSWLTVAYASVLFVFLDFKSRREERWLEARYPGYQDYRRRVSRLVPFVY